LKTDVFWDVTSPLEWLRTLAFKLPYLKKLACSSVSMAFLLIDGIRYNMPFLEERMCFNMF
jgi:hypothetical protein